MLGSRRLLLLCALLLAAACDDSLRGSPAPAPSDGPARPADAPPRSPADAAPTPDGPSFPTTLSARGSVEQVQVTHASPGAMVQLLAAAGTVAKTATADAQGSVLFRKVPAAAGYVVESGGVRTAPVTVRAAGEPPPEAAFYRAQRLVPGFQYLETRDGTRLSAYVTLPGPPEAGPYPTVVSYSGYSPSKPGEPIEDYAFLCSDLPAICDPPDDASALFAALLGYATVGVNIRGTGCSGGAYDFFEELQLLDGYDIIETVAAQPWVLHGKVGMVGLSFPGISQLFVASRRPPGLASIAPESVIGNAATTMLPGGILNDGFAVNWVTNVIAKAAPYGQGWERGRVDAGDRQCAENQLLHGQLVDNVAQARAVRFYDPAEHDRYNPTSFADRIDVPVFLSGGWQDEQTGPFFTTLLDRLTSAPAKRVTVYNGIHPDGFAPQVLSEWYAFLELFVARRVPRPQPLVHSLSPIVMMQVFGAGLAIEPTRWEALPTYDAALAAWRAEPPIRAIFESGAKGLPGAPVGTFERGFASWPPPETRAMRLYLRADGTLSDAPPMDGPSASSFALDPDAGDRGNLAPGGRLWDLLPQWSWQAPEPGKAVVFESAPLAEDHVMLGTGSADLWLRSPVDDADLEITLSEVRTDGQEIFVQAGWLRASMRGLAPTSTELWPEQTYYERDHAPLVPGQWTQVRVPIVGFGHAFRAGSRVRVSVDTPGGDSAEWRFDLTVFPGRVTYDIGHDATHPSSVALPWLEGMTAPTPLPRCALRGQPCRPHALYTNTPSSP